MARTNSLSNFLNDVATAIKQKTGDNTPIPASDFDTDLIDVPQFNTSNVISMQSMFFSCSNLSNDSIQNIVNMCLNSNINISTYKNLNNTNSYSPLYQTKFDSSYYSNRLAELDVAGWTY